MIAAVNGARQFGQRCFVAGDRVEIDHGVELAARAYPLINHLTIRLAPGSVIAGETAEGHDSRTDYSNTVAVSAGDHLTKPGDQIVRDVHHFALLAGTHGGSDVVHSGKYHQPFHARHGDDVAIKATERTRSQTVAQNTAAARALIEDGDVRRRRWRQETTLEKICPQV